MILETNVIKYLRAKIKIGEQSPPACQIMLTVSTSGRRNGSGGDRLGKDLIEYSKKLQITSKKNMHASGISISLFSMFLFSCRKHVFFDVDNFFFDAFADTGCIHISKFPYVFS